MRRGNSLAQCAVLALLSFALYLTGLDWGLPGRYRIDAVLPDGLDGPPFHASLEASWKAMHEKLGPNLMLSSQETTSYQGHQTVRAGWKIPPEILVNPIRSFYVRSAQDDEQSLLLILSKMKPRQLQFKPSLFVYGGGYVYPLGAWMMAGTFLGSGKLSTSLAAYMPAPEDLAGLYFSGRLLSAVCAAATAFLLCFGFRKWMSARSSFLAAMFFLLSPAVVVQAHILKPHTYWTLLAVGAFYLACRLLDSGTRKNYLLAGAAFGAATGSFLMAAPLCGIVAAAAWLRVRAGSEAGKEAMNVLCAALAAVGVFFLLNPYWILAWREVVAEWSVTAGYGGLRLMGFPAFLTTQLRLGAGLPVVFAAAAFLGMAFRRGGFPFLLAAALLLSMSATLVTEAGFNERGVRYCLSAIAFCSLGAGFIFDKWLSSARWMRLAWAGLTIALVHGALLAGAQAANYAQAAGPNSSHFRAARWIEDNVPEGASVGLLVLPRPENAPYLRLDRQEWWLIDPAMEPPKDLPAYLVVWKPEYKREIDGLLSGYDFVAGIERPVIAPGYKIHPLTTNANPVFHVYKRKN